jgi:L-alanine-DL-glutamate epimerase-like enolase superfamily enzyme
MSEPTATIARVEVRSVAPDAPRYRYTDLLPEVYKTTTIVRVVDTDGNEGVGAYDSDSYDAHDLAPLEALRVIAHRLVGRDAYDREVIWHELREHGTSPFMPAEFSAVDVALWDLIARRAGLPLYRFLGGARHEITAYASTPMLPDTAAYLDAMGDWLGQGYRAVKFHAWCDPARDVEMLRAVAAAHEGRGLALMHDAEQLYDRRAALFVGRALEELSFRWFEAPLPDRDLDGYAWLREHVTVPLLPAGNIVWDLRDVRDALTRRPWDAVRIDVTWAGGVTPSLKLFALAEAHAMDVELLSYGHTLVQAANLHVALAFRNTSFFEQAVPVEDFEFGAVNPIRVDAEGHVRAPDGPGLGIELDWEQIDSATLASFTVPG